MTPSQAVYRAYTYSLEQDTLHQNELPLVKSIHCLKAGNTIT